MIDYRARYYDPRLGRFISPDSIVPNPGDPQDLNRFSCVASNPLKYTDPSGHCIWDACIVESLALVAVGTTVMVWYYQQTQSPEFQQAVRDVTADIHLDLSIPQFPLDNSETGWGETLPLDPPPDPYYTQFPTLDTPEWQPVFPGVPLDKSGTGTNVLDFPLLDQPALNDHVLETSGIYEFPDLKYPGKTYVGQSSNIERRLKRWERVGRYEPGTATTTSVPGDKLDREIAEQNRINELGGLRRGEVSNQRNPVGPNRIEKGIERGLMYPYP